MVAFEYGGFDLSTYAWNVRLLGYSPSAPPRRGDNVAIAGKTGRLWTWKPLDERSITLGMYVLGRHPTSGDLSMSRTQAKANLDALLAAFAKDGQQELKMTLDDGKTRVAQAEVVKEVEFRPTGPDSYSLVAEFVLADPLWHDSSATTVQGEVIQSPQNYAINNPGTYKSDNPVLTLTGPLAGPKLTITLGYPPPPGFTGIWCAFNGALGGGDTLVIDCGKYEAKVNGVLVRGAISHDGAIGWLEIPSGVSTLVLESSGFGGGSNLKLDYYPAYL